MKFKYRLKREGNRRKGLIILVIVNHFYYGIFVSCSINYVKCYWYFCMDQLFFSSPRLLVLVPAGALSLSPLAASRSRLLEPLSMLSSETALHASGMRYLPRRLQAACADARTFSRFYKKFKDRNYFLLSNLLQKTALKPVETFSRYICRW